MRILLVEDDIPLARGLQQSLRTENYAIDWVSTGEYALNAVRTGEVELLILDLGLPDMDGLDVLRQAKSINPDIPVLILTARDGIESKVAGLDLGAEDYLAKPFEMAELLARIRVIERRHGTSKTSLMSIGVVSLDAKASLLFVNNEPVKLSRKEYMIAKALIENAGRIQSKAQLENKLYEWGEETSSNTIEVHVSNLRKKLPKDFVHTVRGVGYIVRQS